MEVRLENVGLERNGKKLLEGLNLTIHPGSFVGVLGPSGAGKSLTVIVRIVDCIVISLICCDYVATGNDAGIHEHLSFK